MGKVVVADSRGSRRREPSPLAPRPPLPPAARAFAHAPWSAPPRPIRSRAAHSAAPFDTVPLQRCQTPCVKGSALRHCPPQTAVTAQGPAGSHDCSPTGCMSEVPTTLFGSSHLLGHSRSSGKRFRYCPSVSRRTHLSDRPWDVVHRTRRGEGVGLPRPLGGRVACLAPPSLWSGVPRPSSLQAWGGAEGSKPPATADSS